MQLVVAVLSQVVDTPLAVRPAKRGRKLQRFLLHAGVTDVERSAYARLTEGLGDSQCAVEVYGRAHAHKTAEAGLSVQDFQWLE